MSKNEWPFYISYSWETDGQTAIIEKIKKDLESFPKLDLCLDKDKCNPGDSISAFIDRLGTAARVVLVLSKPYFESVYTLREFAKVIKHGGINTRVKVILVDGFRLDRFLPEAELNSLKMKMSKFNIDFDVDNYKNELNTLSDSLVSISHATSSSDYSSILKEVLESCQIDPDFEVVNEEIVEKLRKTELIFIKAKIKKLIDGCDELKLFGEAVFEYAAETEEIGKIEDILCPLEVADKQQYLLEEVFYPAFIDSLEQLKDKELLTNIILDKYKTLVGWIVTSFVNDDWVKKNRASLLDKQASGGVYLTLDNGHIFEIFIARIHNRHAIIHQTGISSYRSDCGLIINVPNAVNNQNTLLFVFQKLMRRFMPDADYNDATSKNWQRLNSRIRLKRHRENIFIAFHSPEQWLEVRSSLSKELKALPQLWIQDENQGESYLLMPEIEIDAFISESVNLIEDHRKYVKTNQPETV